MLNLRVTGLIVCASLLIALPIVAQPAPLAAWTQLGPGGTVIVRAVTSGACPSGTVGGQSRIMAIRAPVTPSFPVTVCEIVLGPRPPAFTIASAPVPRHTIQKIVLVGDLLYREAACPAGQTGCANSPWGYNWQTNNTDFFVPARPLLAAAPWIFVRGDHESCSRNGAAWFSFFEPRSRPAACQDFSDPYSVPLGSQDLVVFDSSNAADETANAAQVPTYASQL